MKNCSINLLPFRISYQFILFMAYGLYLTVDQKEWREYDFSDTDLLTGTIYTDEAKTSAKNLTGYTVDILIYKDGSSAAHFDKTATIVTAANGTWSYAVAEGEMVPAGLWKIEAEISQSGQRVSTYPVDFLVTRSATS